MNNLYALGFIHPRLQKIIYLHASADIESICYDKNPKLYGCTDIQKAKKYVSVDSIKADLFKLRYHHRRFLNIPAAIVKVAACEELAQVCNDINTYYIDDFYSES